MKDFSQGAKYLNLIQHRFPRVLRQTKIKFERRGNARNDTSIRITPLLSATKSHQFDSRGSLVKFVDHVCHKLVHIYIKEGLLFESRDANHPILDIIGHNLPLLECRDSVHREILYLEINQFREGMQYLDRRHLPNKVVERCSFL